MGGSIQAAEIVGLVLVAALIAGASTRWGVSAPLVLTAVGILASFVPGIPQYTIEPDLVILGILPPLLYATAIRTPFVDIRTNRRPILLLSVALVLVTALCVGLVVSWLLPGVPLAAGIALGAVVAPPDAVAATAIARRVGLPRRVVTVLEGESLLNDATALVTLRTALVAVSASVTLLEVTLDFAAAVVIGTVVGWVVAAFVSALRRRLEDPVLDTTLSLLAPYLAMIGAEEVGGSGVLAVVVAGLILGHRSPRIQSAASRVTERTLFRTVQFLLESVVFLLIGLQLRMLIEGAVAGDVPTGRIVGVCAAVVVTVIVVRILWVFPATYLPRWLVPAVRRSDPTPPWQAIAVVSWAGMRGVVTLAAALTLDSIQGHETLVLAAFCVVVVSLLVQGASLPAVVRRLGVPGPDHAYEALQQALVLQRAVDAGRARLDQKAGAAPPTVVAALHSWSERLANAVWERLGTSDTGVEPPARAFRRLRVEMLDAEREVVARVHASGAVAAEVLESVLERLDQEEAMLTGFADTGADGTGDGSPSTSAGGAPGGSGRRAAADDCSHLRGAPELVPAMTPGGCQECLEIGERGWVSLRMCLGCGHIGCCDSSPHRHAQAHFEETAHPVMRSIELGEQWRWCYVDRRLSPG